jgi:hypothetical protein
MMIKGVENSQRRRREPVRLLVAFLFLVALVPLAARADCSSPTAIEGDTLYNSAHGTMQFCDGADWWSMKGVAANLPSCAVGDGIVMTSAGHWACSSGGPP